jgi:hypothetical protein
MAKKRERVEEEVVVISQTSTNLWRTGQCQVPGWPGGEVAALGNRWGDVAINHWTVRGCTGLSGESSAPRPSLRRRTRRSREKEKASWLKITGLSGELTVPAANGRLRDQRATRGRANGRMVTPDCPVRQQI